MSRENNDTAWYIKWASSFVIVCAMSLSLLFKNILTYIL
jgi:hypothetical protein